MSMPCMLLFMLPADYCGLPGRVRWAKEPFRSWIRWQQCSASQNTPAGQSAPQTSQASSGQLSRLLLLAGLAQPMWTSPQTYSWHHRALQR